MLLTACCSFQLYDDALPPDSGNFLFNWSDDDCSILNALAWFRPAREAAARRATVRETGANMSLLSVLYMN